MQKRIRKIGVYTIPFIVFGFITAGCIPQKDFDNAKAIGTKVTFYTSLARSIIQVAETQFPNKPKVKTALVAARASLKSLESAWKAFIAAAEKNETALTAALAVLVFDVFALIKAVKEAKQANENTRYGPIAPNIFFG